MNKDIIYEIIATCGYVGYLPKMPGTWGSLLALLFFVSATNFIPELYFGMFALCVSVVLIYPGVIASTQMTIYQDDDPSEVVIDEFVGMGLSFAWIPMNLYLIILGFILFRLLDIFKPWPIYLTESLPNGWGIMLDDITAGIITSIALYCVYLML